VPRAFGPGNVTNMGTVRDRKYENAENFQIMNPGK
jgi:hypothetical protein